MRRTIESLAILTGTSTKTVPLMRAQKDFHLRSADWAAEGATDGTKTAKIRNETQSLDLTAALTISGVSALAGTAFASIVNTLVKKGDVISLVYTVSVAGTVAPGQASVSMVVDEPLGEGSGPAWAG